MPIVAHGITTTDLVLAALTLVAPVLLGISILLGRDAIRRRQQRGAARKSSASGFEVDTQSRRRERQCRLPVAATKIEDDEADDDK